MVKNNNNKLFLKYIDLIHYQAIFVGELVSINV